MTQKDNKTRRDFLKGTAGVVSAAVGFPFIISSSALGKAGTVAPSNRIVLGCIGMGKQGSSNMWAFLQKDPVQIIAVCDVDDKHLFRARDWVNRKYENNDCTTYKDFREVIGRDNIDAVSLALPDPWHSIPAIMCARAGMYIGKICLPNGNPGEGPYMVAG